MDNEIINNEENNQAPEVIEVDNFNWIVPECCREGWDSCPHVVKKVKKIKNNIGL